MAELPRLWSPGRRINAVKPVQNLGVLQEVHGRSEVIYFLFPEHCSRVRRAGPFSASVVDKRPLLKVTANKGQPLTRASPASKRGN